MSEQSFYDWQQSHKKHHSLSKSLGLSESEFKTFMKDWKNENLQNQIIIVLDIETTGLDPYFNMICEIGICTLNLLDGTIEPIFHVICQEENKEFDDNSWIFQNSDLTLYTVRNAHFLENYREELQEILNLGPCTAYNQSFDFSFLNSRNFKIPKKFWDPMHKLTPILKIPRYNGYKWPSVQEAYNFFFKNENYTESHRALDDAKHEAKIIYATYKYLKEKKSTHKVDGVRHRDEERSTTSPFSR